MCITEGTSSVTSSDTSGNGSGSGGSSGNTSGGTSDGQPSSARKNIWAYAAGVAAVGLVAGVMIMRKRVSGL